MLRYLFALLMMIHGVIHLTGFAKAFNLFNIPQLTKSISRTTGVFWLIAVVLFLTATILFLIRNNNWTIVALPAILISEVLILTVWNDAKWGTVPNFIILFVAISAFAMNHFESGFRKGVQTLLQRDDKSKPEILTNEDIQHLPLPVQRYLRFSGVINQPSVKNARIKMQGRMRSRNQDWFPFEAVQYSFFDNPERLFFMKAKMFGTEVPGYHRYLNQKASMLVKLFGLIPVIQASGQEMDRAETVTFFNDACLMAPAALVDKRIRWEALDSLSAKAIFNNGENKISATLYFNDKGQLINFVSDDRYDIGDMKQYRFSTPVKEYQTIEGRNAISFGEGVWHYPEGEFVYGEFYIKEIAYNVNEFY